MTNSEILRLVLEPFIVTSWRSGCAPPTLPIIVSDQASTIYQSCGNMGFAQIPLRRIFWLCPDNSSSPRYVHSKIESAKSLREFQSPSSRNRSQSRLLPCARPICHQVTIMSTPSNCPMHRLWTAFVSARPAAYCRSYCASARQQPSIHAPRYGFQLHLRPTVSLKNSFALR